MYLNSKFLLLLGEQFGIGAGKQAVPAHYDKCSSTRTLRSVMENFLEEVALEL